MNRKTGIGLWFLLLAFCAQAQSGPGDLSLWYRQPAIKWTEALPIGNGRLGAMIFGGAKEDRIQFNEETLWNGGPRDYHRPGAYRYLDTIRNLLFAGKQKEAEQLAEKEFMGMRSNEGDRASWIKKMEARIGTTSQKQSPASSAFDDRSWKEMEVPAYEGWETVGFDGLDGAVWLRTTFELPEKWKDRDLVLDLNRIRDADYTFVNGKLVGSSNTTDPRNYTIPKIFLTPGKNSIAVLVLNFFDKGGIGGYKDTSRHIGIYPVGSPPSERLSLNKKWKYFVEDDSPPAVPRYQADYQPFGDLKIAMDHKGSVSNYNRSLNLANATATTSYAADGIVYTREYFSSHPHQVIAIRMTANKKAGISMKASLSSPHKKSSVRRIDAQTIALSLAVRHGALRGESFLRVVTKGGITITNNEGISVRNADEVVLYLTAATNFKNYKDVSADPVGACKKQLASLQGQSYENIKKAHNKEYQNYFNSFTIDLGHSENEKLPTDQRIEKFASSQDPSLVSLFVQYARYLLISSSRPGTRPANLQGIWNDLLTPPWGSKYTTNINAEMNYWPAEVLNLSPLHEPLFKMIEEVAATGQKTAQAHYSVPGWVLHHNTDLWRGSAPINASNHGIWVTGGAWLCQHLWEHYRFTGDLQFLKTRAYPLMKSAALFFTRFLIKDPVSGKLISTPSNSPENGGLVAGPTMDHQIIRNLYSNTIEAAKILSVDEEFRKTLGTQISQIAPNKIGRFGQLQEWMEDKDDTSNKHRHVSHLWGVYPGSEINWDDSQELMKAARQSLIYRGDAGTGWSLAWKINFWARFKDGDHAYKMVRMLIHPAAKGGGAYPNLFDAHPPFQIDGNFGGAAGIAEMIVQSHTNYLDILPALPTDLPEGSVGGICARDGFLLNIKWSGGKLQEVHILSRNGNPLNLRYGQLTKELKTEKGKWYRFDGSLVQHDPL